MSVQLKVEGLVPGTVGEKTAEELRKVFESCLNLAILKEQSYGGAWRHQGWMGNFARVMSKVARLRSMLWQSNAMIDHAEAPEDSLLDLINISTFMFVNFRDGNRWGAP